MRLITTVLGAGLLATALPLTATAAARPTAQAAHCQAQASQQKLKGASRADFIKTCLAGPLAARTPTAPTASSQEAQAVTKPSGVGRVTRTQQCQAEENKKHLAGAQRRQYQLSCLATAGPVTEAETGAQEPKPGKAIKGIGVNNYVPGAAPAKSASAPNPPAPLKPRG